MRSHYPYSLAHERTRSPDIARNTSRMNRGKRRMQSSIVVSVTCLFVGASRLAAWTPSMTSSRTNTVLQSSSSYEEQYAALYNSFTEAQPLQPPLSNDESMSSDATYPSPSFPAETNVLSASSSYLQSQSPTQLEYLSKQESFLDFISTPTDAQLQYSTDSFPQWQKSEPKSLKNITTSLEFSTFGSPFESNEGGESFAISERYPFSYPQSSSANQPSYTEIRGSTSNAPPCGSSSYLDSLTIISHQAATSPWTSTQYHQESDNLSRTSAPALGDLQTQESSVAVDYNYFYDAEETLGAPQAHSQDKQYGGTDNVKFSFKNERQPVIQAIPLDLQPAAIPPSTMQTPIKIETITVQVQTILPKDVTISQAKQAWLQYCWKQGGGIMVPTFSAESLNKRDDQDQDIPPTREFLVPYGLKQELVEIDSSAVNKGVAVVAYRTTRRGPLWQDVVEGSHLATVEFVAEHEDGNDYRYTTQIPRTRMIWKVQFQVEMENGINSNDDGTAEDDMDFTGMDYTDFLTTRLRYVLSKAAFWKSWTKFQLESATKNFKSYLQTPTNLISIDHSERMPLGVSPREACDAWYEYCWRGGGGGSTLLPPLTFQQGRQRWILPALLEEEIVSMDYDESCHVIYRVNNPNPFTFPVHFHQGNVRFEQRNANTPTMLLWNVQVRPYRRYLGYGVQFWTKSSMAVASRNLRRYLEEKNRTDAPLQAEFGEAFIRRLRKKDDHTETDEICNDNSNEKSRSISSDSTGRQFFWPFDKASQKSAGESSSQPLGANRKRPTLLVTDRQRKTQERPFNLPFSFSVGQPSEKSSTQRANSNTASVQRRKTLIVDAKKGHNSNHWLFP